MRCRFNGGCGNSHSLAVYEGLASELMMKRYVNIGIDSPTQHLAIVAIAMIERIELASSGSVDLEEAESGPRPEKARKSGPKASPATQGRRSQIIWVTILSFPAISFLSPYFSRHIIMSHSIQGLSHRIDGRTGGLVFWRV